MWARPLTFLDSHHRLSAKWGMGPAVSLKGMKCDTCLRISFIQTQLPTLLAQKPKASLA